MRAGSRRWLAGIQSRLIIGFMTVTTIPVVVISIYGAHTHLQALEQMAFDAAADEANFRASKLQQALAGAQSDLFYLSQIPSLDTFIEARRDRAEVDLEYAREKLAKQFETFVGSRRTYRAAAYLDSRGREIVRVNRSGTTTLMVPAEELTIRPIYHDLVFRGDGLLAGQTLTHVEVDGGLPVVYFFARLFPRGARERGFVLLEVSLSSLWEDDEESAFMIQSVVLDEHGEVLMGSPDVVNANALESLRGFPGRPMETGDGRILTYIPLDPGRTNTGGRWSFVAAERGDILFGELSRYRQVFTLVLILSLLAAGGMSVLLARQFTEPLKRLYTAAQSIGRGQFDVDLTDRTGDEIGGLAQELALMADQLKIKHEDMQQQIDDKTRELLQAERLSTIGTMSAAIAHEVNNPLGIISLYSQMLSEQLPADDPKTEKLRTIAREAGRMSVLVRGLLQFARRPEPTPRTVDLPRLIDEAIELSRSQHERTEGIDVIKEVSEGSESIEADPDQLTQVLRNLLVNAFKAMDDGGTVRVSAETAEGERVVIRVADTGRGIDPDHLPKLFEPFFSTRRFGAGTGLGLAISKEIVEHHGGSIAVSSRVGEGTTFLITLPRKAKMENRTAQQVTQ